MNIHDGDEQVKFIVFPQKIRLIIEPTSYLYVFPNDILLAETNAHYPIVWAVANNKVYKACWYRSLDVLVARLPFGLLWRFNHFAAINAKRFTIADYVKNEIHFEGGFIVSPSRVFSKAEFKYLGM